MDSGKDSWDASPVEGLTVTFEDRVNGRHKHEGAHRQLFQTATGLWSRQELALRIDGAHELRDTLGRGFAHRIRLDTHRGGPLLAFSLPKPLDCLT